MLLTNTEVDIWDDSYITSGSIWRSAIEDAVDRARVAVLFISNHFHASDFIQETELKLLRAASRAGRVRLLWLSIDGALPAAPEQTLQSLHDPQQPIASLQESSARDLISHIVRDVEDAFYATLDPSH
jgi:hypothetical protein